MQGWAGSAQPDVDGEGAPSKRMGLIQERLQQTPQPLPEEKSWGDLNTFSAVPDQLACGSCWALAATRVMQAHSEIHTAVPRTFSAQQLVSCVPNPNRCGGEGGCQGATVELAYRWVMQHGLANASEVPYFGNETSCGISQPMALASTESSVSNADVRNSASSFGMTGWEKTPMNKYRPLMQALAEHGPVAVSVSAHNWGLYETGIFNGCPEDVVIGHAVVLIGYGQTTVTNTTVKFWQVQNSWGPFWGEAGKMRLLRQDTEQEYCGINTEPEKGIGCRGGPKNVTVCGMCGILYNAVMPFF